jgi:hypothetical protein
VNQVLLRAAAAQLVEERDRLRIRTVCSDSNGEFAIEDAAPGMYLIGFYDPRLDSLLIAVPPRRIEVTARAPPRVLLAVSSITTVRVAHCGTVPRGDDEGVLLGRLHETMSNPAPAEPAVRGVRVSWTEIVLGGRAGDMVTPSRSALPDAIGAFVLCGVPVDVPLRLQAWSAGDSSGAIDVTVPATGIGMQDTVVGHRNGAPGDSTLRRTRHAPARGVSFPYHGDSDANGRTDPNVPQSCRARRAQRAACARHAAAHCNSGRRTRV